MHTVILPMFDVTGALTPLVVEAMDKGATSEHNDATTIKLNFDTAKAARDFEAVVKPFLPVEEIAAPSDPVDDQADKPKD